MMMLDPNTVQVLFADLQPQIVARSKTNTPDALARSAAVLVARSDLCAHRVGPARVCCH